MSLRLFLFCLALGCPAWAQTYLIYTIAGNGTQGYTGDQQAATAAELALPGGIAWDSKGNMYIADGANNRIRIVSNGVITTFAGTGTAGFSGDKGPATSAELNDPTGVAVDGSGNVYIADSANNVVRVVSTAGTITTFAGQNSAGAGYIGDGGPATNSQLNVPTAVAVDSQNNVYIADANNNAIRIVTNGTINTVQGTNYYLNYPNGIAVDAAGDIFVADTGNERVVEFTAVLYDFFVIAGTGVPGFSGDNGQAVNADLCDPKGVAVDSQGYVYIADTINSRVRKVGLDGTITTIAGTGQPAYGGQGQYATGAPMYFPAAVGLDPSGNVNIVDTGNSVVRMLQVLSPAIDINGVVNTADFAPEVSQGGLASIVGVNLSSGKGSAPAPFVTEFGDVTVMVNGVASPILYISPTLINFQVPWQTQPGTAAVQLTVNGQNAPTVGVKVGNAAPGIFMLSAQYASVFNDDGTLNTAGNPAKEGSQISVYLTGSGPVNPPLQNGVPSPAIPLSVLTSPYSATIGTANAPVVFAEMTPESVGVVQLNIMVPTGLAPKGYPLILTIDGDTSNSVTVNVTP
jgi:uncharacterized protein (TIGR03437 family)